LQPCSRGRIEIRSGSFSWDSNLELQPCGRGGVHIPNCVRDSNSELQPCGHGGIQILSHSRDSNAELQPRGHGVVQIQNCIRDSNSELQPCSRGRIEIRSGSFSWDSNLELQPCGRGGVQIPNCVRDSNSELQPCGHVGRFKFGVAAVWPRQDANSKSQPCVARTACRSGLLAPRSLVWFGLYPAGLLALPNEKIGNSTAIFCRANQESTSEGRRVHFLFARRRWNSGKSDFNTFKSI